MQPSTLLRPVLLAGAAAILANVTHAQSILGPPSEANHFIETPKGWVHPKTPWGEPDIQATLNMMQAAGVPLERCASSYRFGAPPCDMNKKWLTDDEYKQRLEAARTRIDPAQQALADGQFGRALLAGVVDPSTPQRQTNLIVDPPSGLLPDLTPEGKRRALKMGSSWALPGEDPAYENTLSFDFWDNCRSRGMPSSMMPYRYNGGFAIRQAPGVVVFDLEMIHDARVIPTDGSKHPASAIKSYMGESRGHWEGNTLVVETTNYKEGPPMINLAVVGSPPGDRFPVSDRMKTTERITRLNDDAWLYEIKTEDPVILTRSFTVRYPMRNDPSYEWWEYACHEGNSIITNYITTSRYERAHPAPQKAIKVEVPASFATALAGRWVGRPRIVTLDLDIELEFTKNSDGTLQGKLVGTNFGKIDKPLREVGPPPFPPPPGTPAPVVTPMFRAADRRLDFELPNTQPWSFSGQLSEDGGSIVGVISSAQGGLPVTFKKR
jgi:hypothetical protein